jgi:hypothetical protein
VVGFGRDQAEIGRQIRIIPVGPNGGLAYFADVPFKYDAAIGINRT